MDSNSMDTGQQVSIQPPRSSSDVLKIRILSVMLALVVVSFAFYILVSEGMIRSSPPYPSEDTPLTLQPWGVTWNREYEMTIGDLPPGLSYSDMYIHLTRYDEGGLMGWESPFATGEFINLSTFEVPATIEVAEESNWLGHSIYWENGLEVHAFTCYFVYDDTDSLNFNIGDTISFFHLVFENGTLSSSGFEEDIVYEIELAYDGHGSIYEGYGFAVHNDKLYSWIDRGPIDDPLS